MKPFTTKNLLLTAFCCLAAVLARAQVCDNLCLDFDGQDDHLNRTLSTPLGNSDFTFECWFRTTGNACPNPNTILYLGGGSLFTGTYVEIVECAGHLSLSWKDGAVHGPVQINTGVINDDQWRHLAVVRQGDNLLTYVNCVLTYDAHAQSEMVGAMNLTTIQLGADPFVSPTGWKGQLDEVRLWNTFRTSAELCDNRFCTLSGVLPAALQLYWTFDMDGAQGGGDNSPGGTNITTVHDATANGNDSGLPGFSLNGSSSNYECAFLPSNYVMAISDLNALNSSLTSICSGSPVHFCILENHGPVVAPPGTTVSWEFSTGANWMPVAIPAFSGFCFPVGPGQLVCNNNPLGYEDVTFRAVITKTMAGQVCHYFSPERTLRICCPLSGGAITFNVQPPGILNGSLCEGDVADIDVSLSGVTGIGSGSTVSWTLNGAPMDMYDDQTSFTYHANPAGGHDLCFEARIENCSCAPLTLSNCIQVDSMPVCGLIEGDISSGLTLISTDPATGHKYYSICPGNDGVIQKVDPLLFDHGKAVWQFQFPGHQWIDLGASNDQQNTNVLPCLKPANSPYLWPAGETCINYRIENRPKSSPSGCDPCYSNEVTVCLLTPPDSASISGNSPICKGGTSHLTVSPYNPALTYTWLHNGEVVGTGQSYDASEAGNYWVEISNGCQVTVSSWFILNVCEVKAAISCPLSPNQCACEGHPISLSGCVSDYSKDNCSGNHAYAWTFSSGTLVNVNTCNLEHIPDAAGTTYTLTVTNTDTGCSDTATLTIVPCSPE